MIEANDRKVLKGKARERWEELKHLRPEVAYQCLSEGNCRSEGHRLHVMEVVGQRAGAVRTRPLRNGQRDRSLSERTWRLFQQSGIPSADFGGRTLLETLADGALALRTLEAQYDGYNELTALVASADLNEVIRIKEVIGNRCGYVLGALDAGTALGLAINSQPDFAIIDTHLEVADGGDLVLTFPFYAPQTKALVLTDEAKREHDIRTVGYEVRPRNAADETLLDWIAHAAA